MRLDRSQVHLPTNSLFFSVNRPNRTLSLFLQRSYQTLGKRRLAPVLPLPEKELALNQEDIGLNRDNPIFS